jgi:hypothetical protein
MHEPFGSLATVVGRIRARRWSPQRQCPLSATPSRKPAASSGCDDSLEHQRNTDRTLPRTREPEPPPQERIVVRRPHPVTAIVTPRSPLFGKDIDVAHCHDSDGGQRRRGPLLSLPTPGTGVSGSPVRKTLHIRSDGLLRRAAGLAISSSLRRWHRSCSL